MSRNVGLQTAIQDLADSRDGRLFCDQRIDPITCTRRQTRVSGNHTHDGDLLDIAILVLEQDYPIVLR